MTGAELIAREGQVQKTGYVVGFMFTPSASYFGDRVVLIEKRRPSWQAGLLNGIGGHIEDGETPLNAMTREFKEETGIKQYAWEDLAVIEGEDFILHAFFCLSANALNARTVTDETVRLCPIDRLQGVVPNLRWLIPIALDVYIAKPIRVAWHGIKPSRIVAEMIDRVQRSAKEQASKST